MQRSLLALLALLASGVTAAADSHLADLIQGGNRKRLLTALFIPRQII